MSVADLKAVRDSAFPCTRVRTTSNGTLATEVEAFEFLKNAIVREQDGEIGGVDQALKKH